MDKIRIEFMKKKTKQCLVIENGEVYVINNKHKTIDRYFNGIGDEYAKKISAKIDLIIKSKYKSKEVENFSVAVHKSNTVKSINGFACRKYIAQVEMVYLTTGSKTIPSKAIYSNYPQFYQQNYTQFIIPKSPASNKSIEATLWTAGNFPIHLNEFIPILYLLSLSTKNIAMFIDFFASQDIFRKDFPILVSLPVMLGIAFQFKTSSIKLVDKYCGFTKEELKYDRVYAIPILSPIQSIKSSLISLYDDAECNYKEISEYSITSYGNDSLSEHDIEEMKDNIEADMSQPEEIKDNESLHIQTHIFSTKQENIKFSENIRDSIVYTEKSVPPIKGIAINFGSKYLQDFVPSVPLKLPDIPLYSAVKIHDKWRQNEILHTIESRSSSHSNDNDENNEESTQRSKQSIFKNYIENKQCNILKLGKSDVLTLLSKCTSQEISHKKKTEDADAVLQI